MSVRRTYIFKLYQSKRLKHLDNTRYVSSQVYNHCITLHNRYYALYGKHLNKNKLQAHLAKIKKTHKPQWKVLDAQSVQDITERIQKGYDLFFSERKKGNKRIMRPSFRKARRYRSFTLKQTGWKLTKENEIQIQGKRYRFWESRALVGDIKTVTLKKDSVGDWYVCFSLVINSQNEEYAATGKSVGMDFGLKQFLTLSDSTTIDSPLFFKQNQKALKKASQSLSSKKKGSHNRHKARVAKARLERKTARQRQDFHWQTANTLAKRFDVVCIEDLNLSGMKALWGRKVSDLGFGAFVTITQHTLQKRGKKLVKIDQWFPSSKTCSSCGWIKKDLTLRDRIWACEGCGSVLERDENASINIEREGVRVWTLAGESVRQPAMVA